MHGLIVIVFGLPGSGKSFFAEKLAQILGATYISSDQLRTRFFPKKDYSLEAKEKVYIKMKELAETALISGGDVVLDATFYLKKWRNMVVRGFKGLADCHFIEVYASEELIEDRTRKKRPFSDADFEVYKQLKRAFEPMNETHLRVISTNDNVREMVKTALNYLKLKKENYGSEGGQITITVF